MCRWKVLPFHFTNAVSAFQHIMKKFIERHNLKYADAYLDNIPGDGMDQESHDAKLKALKRLLKLISDHLTFDESKCQNKCPQI